MAARLGASSYHTLPQGTLEARLTADRKPFNQRQRLQLAADAAEAVAVLHANAIVHGDIQLRNFMLDSEARLLIIDFAGSTLQGQQGTAIEGVRYFLPRELQDPSTVQTDLFALGSVLYAILYGRELYAGKSEEEISQLLYNEEFPPVADVPCGGVILDCWVGACPSAEQAFIAISRKLREWNNADERSNDAQTHMSVCDSKKVNLK